MLLGHEQPEIFDLFTKYRALPLMAEFTEVNGFGCKEFKKVGPDFCGSHSMLVWKPSGDKIWLHSHELDSADIAGSMLSWLREALR